MVVSNRQIITPETGSNFSMLLNFVDKSFDVKRLIHYRLSIQIGLNGFSFCVFDTALLKHVVLRNYQFQRNVSNYDDLAYEVSLILAKDDCLSLKYAYVFCIYLSAKHTLIPANLFNRESLRGYLEFVAPFDDLDEIHYYHYSALGMYSIFTVPSQVASKLISTYSRVQFANQATSLIGACLSTDIPKSLFINLHDGIADMVLKVDNKLCLHNLFEIFHLNDVVYYVTAILHQFKIKLGDIPVYISGDILKEEIDELLKYLPLLEINNNHRMAVLVGHENAYRYYNLLTSYQCE